MRCALRAVRASAPTPPAPCQAAVKAMRAHPAVGHVNIRGASALRNLAGSVPHAARAGEAGAVEALASALCTHARSPEVAVPVLGALRNVCVHAPNAARAAAAGAPAGLLASLRAANPPSAGLARAAVFAAANLVSSAAALRALAEGGLVEIMDALPPGALTGDPGFARLRAHLRGAAAGVGASREGASAGASATHQ